ncbi:hypothetical protein GGR50DRAFT_681350 [Xylaria sp. CBS 124048]|nr:hypothetical protein GGR50DRAFT_681350 [Xylaria sp. CBS 124048]
MTVETTSDQTPNPQKPIPPNTLPTPKTHITTHAPSGKASLHASTPTSWTTYENGAMAFAQIYTNPVPADLNNNADIDYHAAKIASGTLGLAVKSGTVCRMVDFAPGYLCMMHRTQSLDFGVVLEGEIEMLLDDGSVTSMSRGDVAVQRATMHAWRNPSTTTWSRMIFVLQDTKPLFVDGKRYGEDLGEGTEGVLPSKNDD